VKVSRHVSLALLAAGLLTACGFKGDLYLPDQARDIVTRPSQSPPAEGGEAPNSPRTPDSPVEPPSPAPEVTAPTSPDADDKREQKPGTQPPR
jgi:predicted small lipoprotein YifL